MLDVKEAMFRVVREWSVSDLVLEQQEEQPHVKSGSLLLRLILEPSEFMKPTF